MKAWNNGRNVARLPAIIPMAASAVDQMTTPVVLSSRELVGGLMQKNGMKRSYRESLLFE
jgi:hypothetical protein